MTLRSLRTMSPPLNAAATFSSSGSTYMLRPRGGRPLVTQNRPPRSRIRCTASIVRCVSSFALVIKVPSTSANRATMEPSVLVETSDAMFENSFHVASPVSRVSRDRTAALLTTSSALALLGRRDRFSEECQAVDEEREADGAHHHELNPD